jgi:hypothetical protein
MNQFSRIPIFYFLLKQPCYFKGWMISITQHKRVSVHFLKVILILFFLFVFLIDRCEFPFSNTLDRLFCAGDQSIVIINIHTENVRKSTKTNLL